jgi:hypothetical protein
MHTARIFPAAAGLGPRLRLGASIIKAALVRTDHSSTLTVLTDSNQPKIALLGFQTPKTIKYDQTLEAIFVRKSLKYGNLTLNWFCLQAPA